MCTAQVSSSITVYLIKILCVQHRSVLPLLYSVCAAQVSSSTTIYCVYNQELMLCFRNVIRNGVWPTSLWNLGVSVVLLTTVQLYSLPLTSPLAHGLASLEQWLPFPAGWHWLVTRPALLVVHWLPALLLAHWLPIPGGQPCY